MKWTVIISKYWIRFDNIVRFVSVSRSIICWCKRQGQIIDLGDTNKSWYFVKTINLFTLQSSLVYWPVLSLHEEDLTLTSFIYFLVKYIMFTNTSFLPRVNIRKLAKAVSSDWETCCDLVLEKVNTAEQQNIPCTGCSCISSKTALCLKAYQQIAICWQLLAVM